MVTERRPTPRTSSSLLSTSELIGLSRRVGTSLRSGIEVRRVWEHESQRGSTRFRHAMLTILEHVKQGETVSAAMRAAHAFPPVMLAMVEIGEHTGKLDEALLKLAEHYEHQASLRRQFFFGIAWPGLQLLAAILVISLLIYILDALGGTQLDGTPWDVTGLGLRGASGVAIFLTAIGVILGGGVTLVVAVLYGWLGPKPIQFAMKLPLIGSCLRHSAMSRLSWSLGMALDAGMDAKRSVELSLVATQNPFYLSRIDAVVGTIDDNREFYEAFRDAGGFPDDFLLELETAEIAGTLSESLVRMAREYNDRAKSALNLLTWACVIGIWLMMGTIMVALIFRLFYLAVLKPMDDASKWCGILEVRRASEEAPSAPR
jgi:type II secretory pathway component PulF